jgi:hypothetical protein
MFRRKLPELVLVGYPYRELRWERTSGYLPKDLVWSSVGRGEISRT